MYSGFLQVGVYLVTDLCDAVFALDKLPTASRLLKLSTALGRPSRISIGLLKWIHKGLKYTMCRWKGDLSDQKCKKSKKALLYMLYMFLLSEISNPV